MNYKRFMNEFNTNIIASAPTFTKKKGRIAYQLLQEYATIDTEVTTIKQGDEGVGLLYIWAMRIFGYFIYGRTIDEFKEFAKWLYVKCNIHYKRRLVVYAHNLEYDWQFLQAAFKKPEVFATEKRAVLTAYSYGMEFRCSYRLTNMSLDKFTNAMGSQHRKQSGEDFDYGKIRTPDTPIPSDDFTIKNMYYLYCDVVGLHEAIKIKMDKDNDNVATIPLTSTGYVRRDARKAMLKNKRNRQKFEEMAIDKRTYTLNKEAFRGGNTHANRNYSGLILDNVKSFDIASSYPSVIMYEKFPMGAMIRTIIRPEDIDLVLNSDYWIMFDITFKNISTDAPIPYISIDKTIEYDIASLIPDNGRILYCDEVRMICLSDDLRIVLNHYEYSEIIINDAYYSKTDYLPIELRQITADYYINKTKLKGVEGEEYYYAKSKNLLNSIFGMCVQDPVHDTITIEGGQWGTIPVDIDESLRRFYKSYNSFLSYQWGVTITAKARARLQEAIDICGDKIVYVDTDSVKFINDKGIVNKLLQINDRIIDCAHNSDVTCVAYTQKGETQVMGIWDDETNKYAGGVYDKFRTYGAKKYAYEYIDCKGERHFEITVAGLNKKKGAKEIREIDNFIVGLTVKDAGRTRAIYDDNVLPHYVNVQGKDYKIYSNIAILDVTYTLDVTDDYVMIAPNIYDACLNY